jgi:hypothetical protein
MFRNRLFSMTVNEQRGCSSREGTTGRKIVSGEISNPLLGVCRRISEKAGVLLLLATQLAATQ